MEMGGGDWGGGGVALDGRMVQDVSCMGEGGEAGGMREQTVTC